MKRNFLMTIALVISNLLANGQGDEWTKAPAYVVDPYTIKQPDRNTLGTIFRLWNETDTLMEFRIGRERFSVPPHGHTRDFWLRSCDSLADFVLRYNDRVYKAAPLNVYMHDLQRVFQIAVDVDTSKNIPKGKVWRSGKIPHNRINPFSQIVWYYFGNE